MLCFQRIYFSLQPWLFSDREEWRASVPKRRVLLSSISALGIGLGTLEDHSRSWFYMGHHLTCSQHLPELDANVSLRSWPFFHLEDIMILGDIIMSALQAIARCEEIGELRLYIKFRNHLQHQD